MGGVWRGTNHVVFSRWVPAPSQVGLGVPYISAFEVGTLVGTYVGTSKQRYLNCFQCDYRYLGSYLLVVK